MATLSTYLPVSPSPSLPLSLFLFPPPSLSVPTSPSPPPPLSLSPVFSLSLSSSPPPSLCTVSACVTISHRSGACSNRGWLCLRRRRRQRKWPLGPLHRATSLTSCPPSSPTSTREASSTTLWREVLASFFLPSHLSFKNMCLFTCFFNSFFLLHISLICTYV